MKIFQKLKNTSHHVLPINNLSQCTRNDCSSSCSKNEIKKEFSIRRTIMNYSSRVSIDFMGVVISIHKEEISVTNKWIWAWVWPLTGYRIFMRNFPVSKSEATRPVYYRPNTFKTKDYCRLYKTYRNSPNFIDLYNAAFKHLETANFSKITKGS